MCDFNYLLKKKNFLKWNYNKFLMNIFGIGIPEIAVIVVLALLIFGPKRLPQLGKTIGKTLKGLQTASKEFENEINKTLKLNENDE